MQHINQPIKTMEGDKITEETTYLEAVEIRVKNFKETGKEVVEAMYPVVYTTAVGKMICVPTKVPIAEPLQREPIIR